jgi:exodeoxyribonuclease-3
MAEHGYGRSRTSEPPPRTNGVAVFARGGLGRVIEPPPGLPASRWVGCELPGAGLGLIATHVPPKISIGLEGKQRFWDALLAFATAAVERPLLFVGDLNTGAPSVDEPRATLYCAPSFVALSQIWVDAWRRFHGPDAREWTWLSPGRGRRIGYGYRLDHAFCTPVLAARLHGCRYDHGGRDAGLSDHSLTLVELD